MNCLKCEEYKLIVSLEMKGGSKGRYDICELKTVQD